MLKLEQRRHSVVKRLEWLEAVNSSIEQFADNSEALAAFSSQKSFAAYNQDGFVGMSLNALKRQANKEFEGGFRALDRLRHSVFERLNVAKEKHERPPQKTTRRDLKAQLKEARKEGKLLTQELLVLTHCLSLSLDRQEYLVNRLGDELDQERFKKQRRVILGLFRHGVRTEVALAVIKKEVVDLKSARKRKR